MKSHNRIFIRFLPFFLVFLLASCSSRHHAPPVAVEHESIPVQSLTVLPAAIVSSDPDPSHSVSKQLEEGAAVLNDAVRSALQGKEDVIYLDASQVESFLGNFQGSQHESARFIGENLDADAVLIPSLKRYLKRVGRTYSVSQPASVEFQLTLIHVPTGRVLCSGTFDETQQGLFENLFSFKKAAGRGFKFITAEEMTKEGVKEKFKECAFLN